MNEASAEEKSEDYREAVCAMVKSAHGKYGMVGVIILHRYALGMKVGYIPQECSWLFLLAAEHGVPHRAKLVDSVEKYGESGEPVVQVQLDFLTDSIKQAVYEETAKLLPNAIELVSQRLRLFK